MINIGILNENGYTCSVVKAGRLINRIGICKYNSKCNIDNLINAKKKDLILSNV